MDSFVPSSEDRNVGYRSELTQRFSRLLRELTGVSHSPTFVLHSQPLPGRQAGIHSKKKNPKIIPSVFWQWLKNAQETDYQK